ncbi:MAG: hypothetical protein CXT73_04525 [Methanobacteriota archaeon]|jgi:hypothetical protein|nr:MAG: hypothetical protein CXT73_04525 [Euryarchaeota archaeon]
MDSNDMIFNKTDGKITSAGWCINSDLLQNDFPLAAQHQVGGGSGAVQNLAVPAGLIILQNMIDSNTKSPLNDLLEEPRVIGEDLYDKLLNLAGRKKRTSHDTRKNRPKRKNKTRKK